MKNAPSEHSAILSTCIKLPSVCNTVVLSICEWPLKTGFTVFVVIQNGKKTANMLHVSSTGLRVEMRCIRCKGAFLLCPDSI